MPIQHTVFQKDIVFQMAQGSSKILVPIDVWMIVHRYLHRDTLFCVHQQFSQEFKFHSDFQVLSSTRYGVCFGYRSLKSHSFPNLTICSLRHRGKHMHEIKWDTLPPRYVFSMPQNIAK